MIYFIVLFIQAKKSPGWKLPTRQQKVDKCRDELCLIIQTKTEAWNVKEMNTNLNITFCFLL